MGRDGKVAVFATLRAREGLGDEVVAAIEAIRPRLDEEPGTEVFLVHRTSKDPDVLWVYERYTDRDAMTAHVHGGALPAVSHLLAEPAEIAVTRVAAGKGG